MRLPRRINSAAAAPFLAAQSTRAPASRRARGEAHLDQPSPINRARSTELDLEPVCAGCDPLEDHGPGDERRTRSVRVRLGAERHGLAVELDAPNAAACAADAIAHLERPAHQVDLRA